MAGIAVILVQLAAGAWIDRYVHSISAGMAALAALCAARTARLTPPIGIPDRWRWQAGTLAWCLWTAQWIANAAQTALLADWHILAKVLSESRHAALIVALAPLAAASDDRRLRWLDAVFGLVFALLMTLLSWPDLLAAERGEPDKVFLYLGYIAMAGFAGLSVVAQPAGPQRRMSWALFVTLAFYAAVGISSIELIDAQWVGMLAPLLAYGDLPFLAYLAIIGRPAPAAAPAGAGLGRRAVLLSRLVPLALTILIVALSFVVANTMRPEALAAGVMALAILVAYAARTALTEWLQHRSREAALAREQARAASLTDLMHELRSPLGAIALNASILRRSGAMVAGAERAALAIDSGCMTISRLLDDVLDLERLEAGLTRSSVARHDLAALVREVAAMMAAEAEEYGIALRVQTEPAAGAVDAAALQRIMLNLLNNALRFTPRGGEVDVALARREGGAVVTIADTGVGLPPEMQANPFRRFATSSRPLHGRRGSGLGLAISHALAGTMGGTIVVDPPAGRGTTFRIVLPVG